MQVPCCVVAVPKSIDNDLLLFDKTFGCAALHWAGRCAAPPPPLRQQVPVHHAWLSSLPLSTKPRGVCRSSLASASLHPG